jgi:hypothetical protein
MVIDYDYSYYPNRVIKHICQLYINHDNSHITLDNLPHKLRILRSDRNTIMHINYLPYRVRTFIYGNAQDLQSVDYLPLNVNKLRLLNLYHVCALHNLPDRAPLTQITACITYKTRCISIRGRKIILHCIEDKIFCPLPLKYWAPSIQLFRSYKNHLMPTPAVA